MSPIGDETVPAAVRPDPEDYGFDLDAALHAVVGLRSAVPEDGFTAEVLGTERFGHGVIIRADGLVATIGYLIAEAQEVWLTLNDGRTVPGHALVYDHITGFGLVQALTREPLPALAVGRSAGVAPGLDVVLAGAGGPEHCVAAQVVARQEFAGYWEYVLEDAIFTAPAHPHWGGTAMIGPEGTVLGIGSLQLAGPQAPINMVVPIDHLTAILDELLTQGRANRPSRPWLGLYAQQVQDKVAVLGVASGGPAHRAGLRTGDLLLGVAGVPCGDLADFFRRVWAQGHAGVAVPLTVWRDGDMFEVAVNSSSRDRFLKKPVAH